MGMINYCEEWLFIVDFFSSGTNASNVGFRNHLAKIREQIDPFWERNKQNSPKHL